MPEQKTKFDDGRWKHEIRKVSDLHPNPDNPRTITKETLKGLKRSMQKNGYTHRIIVDCHNMILSGHARWLVFKEQDPDAEIECMVAQRELTKEEIQEAVLGHRTLGGDWNIEDLQMKFEPILLEAYGLKVDMSDDFDTKEVVEVETPEEVPTRVKPGDIWQLGDHRLICGDSTKQEDVNALLNENKADLLLTDPPYNMNYTGAGGGTMHGKDLSKADCSVNIYCYMLAQATHTEQKAICSIGDEFVNINGTMVPFSDIVSKAREYINNIGGFEKLAEWGLQ